MMILNVYEMLVAWRLSLTTPFRICIRDFRMEISSTRKLSCNLRKQITEE